jgi:predicted nucleic acid-binding protein
VKSILLDTGVIVASLDRSERFHRVCAETIVSPGPPLVTTEAVIVESCYLLRNIPGAAEAVLGNVAEGNFRIPIPLTQSARQVARIMQKYGERRIDLADASLIHLATELSSPDILTLDSDFEFYRWGRSNHFQLLVDLGEKR